MGQGVPRDKAASLDRALEAISTLLTRQTAAAISIADVAAMANCSTATLYQAFNSKEELIQAAMERSRDSWPHPVPLIRDEGAAILKLATYLYRRAFFLGSARSVTHSRAMMRRPAGERHEVTESILDRDPLIRHAELVAQAVDDGDMKAGNPQQIAYCLKAAASFRPGIWGLMLDQQITSAAFIRDVLDPFVTPRGRSALVEAGTSIEVEEIVPSHADR